MTMMTPVSLAWKTVELFVSFHKDRDGKARAKPFNWFPSNGMAKILDDTDDQETIVLIKGADADTNDVQLNVQADKIIASRTHPVGWSNVVMTDTEAHVKVGDTWVTIKGDGSVTRRDDAGTTHIEADGAMMKLTPDAEVIVSGDSGEITRKTEDRIDAMSYDGVLSKRRD